MSPSATLAALHTSALETTKGSMSSGRASRLCSRTKTRPALKLATVASHTNPSVTPAQNACSTAAVTLAAVSELVASYCAVAVQVCVTYVSVP